MTVSPRVFMLEGFPDNPRFRGFSSMGGMLLGCVIPRDRQTRNWRVKRLAKTWKPVQVKGRVNKSNDYPCVEVADPAFSPRAVEALRDLLEPNGELLPIISRVGTYYLYNTTRVADVLDYHSSDLKWVKKPVRAYMIHRYEFFADKLEGLSIFRTPEDAVRVFVTATFVNRAREHNLQGFNFVPVWPLPPNTQWLTYLFPQGDKVQTQSASPPPPKLIWQAPEGKQANSIAKAIADFSSHLGLDMEKMTDDQVQDFVLASIEKLRASKKSKEENYDPAFWLAIAWAQTLVRSLHWEWVMLGQEGKPGSIAIASPDRAFAVYPLEYVRRLAEDRKADLTSKLLFNMIRAGKTPSKPAQSLWVLG